MYPGSAFDLDPDETLCYWCHSMDFDQIIWMQTLLQPCIN